MRFLPIVGRELRVASRRSGTYWIRLGAAGLALMVGGWVMIIPGFQSPQSLGMVLFVALSMISFTYCLLAGVRTTSDCLSEEKREGTLGLLFLTDLNGYDIILGKLAATSLNVAYGILAIFPVMAIPLLLGGVTVAEFWRVMLASLTSLFFSLSAGIFISALSTDDRRAMGGCLGLVFFFTALLPIIGYSIAEWQQASAPHPAFLVFSPGYAAFMSFEETFTSPGPGLNYYYLSISLIALLGLLFLFLACLIVPRTWQDKPRSAASARRHSWMERLLRGSTATRIVARRQMLTINPVYWLTGRDRFKVILVWCSLGMGGLLWLWGVLKYPDQWFDAATYVWTAALAHTLLKIWLASEATRRLAADRKSGALELLLSTPLSIKEIVRGQILALHKQFAAPLVLVLAIDIVFLCTDRTDKEWVWLWLAGIIMLPADIVALAWVGMWLGVSSRHGNRAAGATVIRIMVLPWLIFLLVWTGLALISIRGASSARGWFETLPFTSWIAIGLAVDLAFGLWARRKLYNDFRAAATRGFETRAGRFVKKKEAT